MRLLILAWLGVALIEGIRAGRLVVPKLEIRYVVLAFLALAAAGTIFALCPSEPAMAADDRGICHLVLSVGFFRGPVGARGYGDNDHRSDGRR